MNAYKQLGKGAVLTSVLMARTFILAAVMYLGNTDLLHLSHLQQSTDNEMSILVQQHQTDWGMLAQASDRSLNTKNTVPI